MDKLDIFTDDESHPIPFLEFLDVYAVNKGGGADLVVIIATPLQSDERSQRRLLKKIENYLSYINSEEFLAEAGPPTVENTRIVVKMHPDSEPSINELLDHCVNWVIANNATIIVKTF